MSQHFVVNNLAGLEHNVNNEDFMEEVRRDVCRGFGGKISKHENSIRSLSQLKDEQSSAVIWKPGLISKTPAFTRFSIYK